MAIEDLKIKRLRVHLGDTYEQYPVGSHTGIVRISTDLENREYYIYKLDEKDQEYLWKKIIRMPVEIEFQEPKY